MTLFSDIAPAAGFDLTGDAFIDSLFSPEDYFRTKWTSVSDGKTAVSYSFPFLNGVASRFTADYGGENTATEHFGVTNVQVPGIDLAFQRWADVANIKFTKVTESAGGVVGDIRIAFSSEVSSDFWGYTKIYSDGRDPGQGDIWIEPGIAPGTFQPYTYDFTAIMHEIGHALGLDHPFEGNIIPNGYDDMRYTIMSYNLPANAFYFNGSDPEAEFIITTPGVYDIAAVQAIYGANMEFQTGNNRYAFSPARPVYQSIWDAGGIDTFDVSAFALGCSISLVPGTYSLLGYEAELDANIGIAFNCMIENARGGEGNDTIVGNTAGNQLRGNDGLDTISGGGGNDVIDGGAGNDVLAGGSGSDRLIGGGARDLLTGGSGADTFRFGNGDFGGFTRSTCDRILDFNRAQGDRIDLSAVDANTINGSANDAFAFITGAFGKVAGQLRAVTTAGVTLLQGDTNGDGVADFCIRLEGAPALAASDVVL